MPRPVRAFMIAMTACTVINRQSRRASRSWSNLRALSRVTHCKPVDNSAPNAAVCRRVDTTPGNHEWIIRTFSLKCYDHGLEVPCIRHGANSSNLGLTQVCAGRGFGGGRFRWGGCNVDRSAPTLRRSCAPLSYLLKDAVLFLGVLSGGACTTRLSCVGNSLKFVESSFG